MPARVREVLHDALLGAALGGLGVVVLVGRLLLAARHEPDRGMLVLVFILAGPPVLLLGAAGGALANFVSGPRSMGTPGHGRMTLVIRVAGILAGIAVSDLAPAFWPSAAGDLIAVALAPVWAFLGLRYSYRTESERRVERAVVGASLGAAAPYGIMAFVTMVTLGAFPTANWDRLLPPISVLLASLSALWFARLSRMVPAD